MSTRSRTPVVLAIVLAVVAVLGVAAVALTRGGDDDADEVASTVPAPASVPVDGSDGVSVVTVDGEVLPAAEGPDDPAIGTPAPALSGTDYSGAPVVVEPGVSGPMLLVFMAHWCPHCNREIPVLQEWQDAGGIPDALEVIGVSTAAREDAPNYPPGEWLAEKDWTWPVLADDAQATAAQAYGVTGFPYLVFVDADGNVTARVSGELPIETLQAFADATVTARA